MHCDDVFSTLVNIARGDFLGPVQGLGAPEEVSEPKTILGLVLSTSRLVLAKETLVPTSLGFVSVSSKSSRPIYPSCRASHH